jgi:hypothetical protein
VLFPYYNALWLMLFGGRREGVIVGLTAAYVMGILLYWQFRVRTLAGGGAQSFFVTLILSPLCWFMAGCRGQDETLMAFVLCVGLVLVGRAHWVWVSIAGAIGLLLSKLTFGPLALALTLGTRRPLRCLGLLGALVLGVAIGLRVAGADIFDALRLQEGAGIMGANLLSLLTLLPQEAIADSLRRPMLIVGGMAILAVYARLYTQFVRVESERRSRLTEGAVIALYAILMLCGNKSLADYRTPIFIPAACWFATAAIWTRIDSRRLWACVGYSLLVGLYDPLWSKWIYTLPYRAIWLRAGERLIPGINVPLAPLTTGIMYAATIAIVFMESAAIAIAMRDLRRLTTLSADVGPMLKPTSVVPRQQIRRLPSYGGA